MTYDAYLDACFQTMSTWGQLVASITAYRVLAFSIQVSMTKLIPFIEICCKLPKKCVKSGFG